MFDTGPNCHAVRGGLGPWRNGRPLACQHVAGGNRPTGVDDSIGFHWILLDSGCSWNLYESDYISHRWLPKEISHHLWLILMDIPYSDWIFTFNHVSIFRFMIVSIMENSWGWMMHRYHPVTRNCLHFAKARGFHVGFLSSTCRSAWYSIDWYDTYWYIIHICIYIYTTSCVDI